MSFRACDLVVTWLGVGPGGLQIGSTGWFGTVAIGENGAVLNVFDECGCIADTGNGESLDLFFLRLFADILRELSPSASQHLNRLARNF